MKSKVVVLYHVFSAFALLRSVQIFNEASHKHVTHSRVEICTDNIFDNHDMVPFDVTASEWRKVPSLIRQHASIYETIYPFTLVLFHRQLLSAEGRGVPANTQQMGGCRYASDP